MWTLHTCTQQSYLFSISGGYVKHIRHVPLSATRQGDPLSPAVVSLVSSLVIHLLSSCLPGAVVLMYADDLVIFFPFDCRGGPLKTVIEVLQQLGDYSGLRLNLKKWQQECELHEWSRG